MNFRFLHAADIHLDSPMQGLRYWQDEVPEELTKVTRQALHNLVTVAIEENVDFVLLGGDLYDGDWNDYTTGLVFVHEMARLDKAGIPVILVRGNHDAMSIITGSLQLPRNCHQMQAERPETYRLDTIGAAIHGQSFATRAVHDDLTKQFPEPLPGYFNIGLLHTSATGREQHEPYAPCSEAGLRALGYSYWALGHVHQRETLSQDPWIVFPGNLQARHIREPGAKGCSLVTVSDGQIDKLEHRSVDVLRFLALELDVSAVVTIEDAMVLLQDELRQAQANNEGRSLAVRITFVGSTKIHEQLRREPEQLQAECMAAVETAALGSRIFLEKTRVQTQPWAADEAPEGTEAFLDELLSLRHNLLEDEDIYTSFQEQFASLETLFGSTPALRQMLKDTYQSDAALVRILEDAEDTIRSRVLLRGGDTP